MTSGDIATQFFPARIAFNRDSRVSKKQRLVYEYCLSCMEFWQVREAPVDAIETGSGVDRGDCSRALTWLVQAGYLVEHNRTHLRAPRRFTLAWSLAVGRSPTESRASVSK